LLQIERSIIIFKPELLAKQSFLSHNTKNPRIAGGIFFVSLLSGIDIVQECDATEDE
jgi:hypothetical protein